MSIRVVMAAALVAAASVCTGADATLEVPFVPQGEDLCGGAAAAMVMRYWGVRGVYAEAFSGLVDRSAGGIRTASLVSDLRGRGWTAVEGASDLASLQRELARRRPVVALIEVRPARYHYVVVIGATPDHVVLHDPARGPSRVMRTQAFELAWSKSDHWMLVLLPGSGPQVPGSGPQVLPGSGSQVLPGSGPHVPGRQPDSRTRSAGRPTGQASDDLTPRDKPRPGAGSDSRPSSQPDSRTRSTDPPTGQASDDLTLRDKPRPGAGSDRGPSDRGPDPRFGRGADARFRGGADACGVADAVQLANDGDHAAARAALERATATCGTDAAPWRELAGLDALDANWDAAAVHARRAVEIDPDDGHAWRILATAEYLRHHDAAALEAWNHIGEPSVDLVDVKGLRDTRYAVVADAMSLAPGQTLTPAALRLAEKRARDVPSIAIARITFHPVENGRAQVDAAVVERDRAPVSYPSWIGLGISAAANREVEVSLANPSGGGDLVTATWRWWAHRPLVAASYAAPAPRALGGGTWTVEASRETQTFAPGMLEQTRTRAAFGISRWMTARTRIAGSVGLDSWSDRGRTPSMSGHVEFWPVADRLSLNVNATAWSSASTFAATAAAVHWRSSASTTGLVWLAGSGYQLATSGAPAFVWPGADTGHARDVLLRAHPLLEDGVILAPVSATSDRVGVFGRRLAFANAELQRWHSIGQGKWPIRMAPAAFIDTARATRGFAGTSTPMQVDAGAGIRVSVLGLGVLRVDVAHGLRDGSNALSIGFVR